MSEEKAISLAEIKDLLTAASEKRGENGIEFNSIQKAALMHAQALAALDADQAEELISEVLQLELFQLKSVPEYIAYRVADCLPKYPEDVRAILSKERIALENEEINAILDIVAKYL